MIKNINKKDENNANSKPLRYNDRKKRTLKQNKDYKAWESQ